MPSAPAYPVSLALSGTCFRAGSLFGTLRGGLQVIGSLGSSRSGGRGHETWNQCWPRVVPGIRLGCTGQSRHESCASSGSTAWNGGRPSSLRDRCACYNPCGRPPGALGSGPGTVMAAEVDVRIASDPRWLRLARIVVEGCCREFEFGDTESRAMVSALDEALSNVIRHAYRGDTTRPIRIACRLDGDVFEVEVSDQGHEFDPVAHPLQPPDELRSGGRGIFLIRSSVDECDYARDGEWNRLRLRKRLPRHAAKR